MEPQAWAVLITALGTLLGAAGGFFARSRLGDVLASKSKREETAVDHMAQTLGDMAKSQQEREFRLIGLQEKALDTVGTMSGAIQSFTLALQTHEHDMLELGEEGHNVGRQILESVAATQCDIREMAVILTDLAATIHNPRGANTSGD